MADAPVHGESGSKAGKLHEHAVQAEKHLEQLATGLAQAGAPPEAVKAVGSMAEGVRKILGLLNKTAQAEQPPEPRPTLESASRGLAQDVQAQRQV